MARRVSSHRAAIDESVCSEGGSENPFNDKALIRRLLDGCILSDVVERIDRADPEQRAWDTLGSFLEVSGFLLAQLLGLCCNSLSVFADRAPALHLC